MKEWPDLLKEDPKKTKAAAYEMESSAKMNPPDFSVSSKQANSTKPIQGFFPDLSKKPAPQGPSPIPYPNIGMSSKANKDLKVGGMIGKVGAGINSLAEGAGNIMEGASTKISGVASSFSGQASDYISAVEFGKQMFKLTAGFRNIKIMASVAIGSPGCLNGPKLKSFIKMAPKVASMLGEEASMRDAIAEGVSKNFNTWRKKVTVPGLPWYPAFAAFPGPMAPPMPNVPTPLISCVSSQMGKITSPAELKASIYNNLPIAMQTPENEAFVAGIAAQLAVQFTLWLASQQVMMVMGKGPIPTFDPPFVTVGPVVNGDIIPRPGHLIT
jgi:hypothetical protein